MKRKIMAITLGVALLTVAGGVAAAQFSTDTPKLKTVNSEQPQGEAVTPVQSIAEAPVEVVQTPPAPKTVQNNTTEEEPVEEEVVPTPVTLISTYKCATSITHSVQTSGNTTTKSTTPYLHIVRTYSDESVTVEEKKNSIDLSAPTCANNEVPQPVSP